MEEGNNKFKYTNIFTSRVSKYNRITIPKEIIDIFGIREGYKVTLAILNVVKIDENNVVKVIPAKRRTTRAVEYDELEEVIE